MEKNNTLLTFCLKVMLLVVILFGVDRLVGAAFVKMKDVGLSKNPENMWLKTPYTVEKVDAEVVVVGSSKALHHYVSQMLEDSLDMTVYNCGQDGCFFLYQNCIINMILDRYSPKVILWDIQPGSFVGEDHSLEYQNIRFLSPYYPDNAWAENYINSESSKMRYRMISRMFAYNSKILNYVFPIVTHCSTTEKGYIPLATKGYNYPEMVKEEEKEGEVNKDYLALLDKTMKRCKEKGVELRMYISPVYSQKSALTKSAESEIGNVAKRNSVSFTNVHSDDYFMHNATLFKDASHLNDKGASIFTEEVICKINKDTIGNSICRRLF